ncbi:Probable Zinc-ribbon domain-containing protein [Lachnospiraceae bacterium YSD2013]|nr:Probable Zinc-ribbon domain-containing protein [Lachnospiraceae bacterium YSD2013]
MMKTYNRVKSGINDLLSQFPEIAAEWNYEKNSPLTPDNITKASKQKVWWTCENGHDYEQHVDKRTLRGYNCPICSGKKTVAGINDFAIVYPDIAAEWHPTKNGDKKPSMYSPKNGYRAWWQCKYNHEWQATIHDRSSGTGCPICKNRYSSSFAEQAIFFYVKKLCPDAINRYKGLLDNNREFDVYIPSRKVAIEFDGGYWHNSEESYEREKEKYQQCKKEGISLIRVKENADSYRMGVADYAYYLKAKDKKQLQNIIQGIIDTLDPMSNFWTRRKVGNYHSSIVVDLDKDRQDILGYLYSVPNSLAELRPDLVEEWNYDKNGNLTPDLFGINSNEEAWWRCKICGHEWKTLIIHRAGKRNSGCPECKKISRGKAFTQNRVSERCSLADNCPELMKQWDFSKNTIDPHQITAKYNKKVWWLCDKCNHSWQSSPNNRSKGVGCPCCSGRVPKKGVNDLKTVNPSLAAEWDYEKNQGKRPEDFLPNSGKNAWWKCCKCGNQWEAKIRDRNRGQRCPECKTLRDNG